MKDRVRVNPCSAPPIEIARHQRDVKWFRYEVATASGRGRATGYAPGPEANARRVAIAALNSLQRAEGLRQSRPPGATNLNQSSIRGTHDLDKCLCRHCSNQRYKERTFAASRARKAGSGRVTPRKYGFHELHIGGTWSVSADTVDLIRLRKAAHVHGCYHGKKFRVALIEQTITVRRVE